MICLQKQTVGIMYQVEIEMFSVHQGIPGSTEQQINPSGSGLLLTPLEAQGKPNIRSVLNS